MSQYLAQILVFRSLTKDVAALLSPVYITPLRHGRMYEWLNLDYTRRAAMRQGIIGDGKEILS